MPAIDGTDQMDLIETEHPKAKEFLRLARAIRKCDNEIAEIKETRKEHTQELVALFHASKLTVFRRAEVVATLKETVIIKGRKESAGGSGDA